MKLTNPLSAELFVTHLCYLETAKTLTAPTDIMT
jgi:hypothetical protein